MSKTSISSIVERNRDRAGLLIIQEGMFGSHHYVSVLTTADDEILEIYQDTDIRTLPESQRPPKEVLEREPRLSFKNPERFAWWKEAYDKECDEALQAMAKIGREDHKGLLSFFAYETLGTVMYNKSALLRADFD